MKKNLKRLIFIVLWVCVCSIVFDAYVVINTYDTTKQYNTIINEYVENEEKLQSLGQEIYHIQTLALLGVMTDDSNEREKLWKEMHELDDQNKQILSEVDTSSMSEEETDVFHHLYSDYLTYSNRQNLITSISGEAALSTARYYLNTTMKDTMNMVNGNLILLERMMDDDINTMKASLTEKSTLRTIITVAVAGITIIAIMMLVFVVIKSSHDITQEFNISDRKHREQIFGIHQHTVEGLAELVESRDNSTGTHIKNTAQYVGMIATQLSKGSKYSDLLTNEMIMKLVQYAPLHDVGKIVVSDAVLLKPGRLTAREFEEMKRHAAEGGIIVKRLLSKMESEEDVQLASEIATGHHEWWNGNGYPNGLSGERIPLAARIMAVADVFDALVSERCYKKSFTVEEAYKIIEEDSGTHFEPAIVDAFVALRPQIEAYLKNNKH